MSGYWGRGRTTKGKIDTREYEIDIQNWQILGRHKEMNGVAANSDPTGSVARFKFVDGILPILPRE